MYKVRQINFLAVLPLGTSLPTATPFAHLSLIIIITSLMADTGQNESGRDNGSDVLTDFESEMFCNTTSKTTNKTLPVAGRIRIVRTRRREVSKVPKQNLCRRIRPAKKAPQGKQRSNFRELYLHKIVTQRATSDHAPLEGITTFFQAPPPRQLRRNISSHNSSNGSDFEKLNDPNAAQEEDDESEMQ